MHFVVQSRDEEHTRAMGRALAQAMRPDDVISLSGDLGAGKTALVKGIAEGMGVEEPVTSPTFNILLVHPGRFTLYHFDLYRLDSPGQLEDVDFYEVLESAGVTVIEWGDRFPQAIPDRAVHVRLTIEGESERTLEVDARGPEATRLATGWVEAMRTRTAP